MTDSSADVRQCLSNAWMRAMPTDVMEDAVRCARVSTLADGQRIFSRGDAGDGIYVVMSGAVRFSRATRAGSTSIIALLEANDWFGELSTFDHLPRTHDAHAVGPTCLLQHSESDFEGLLSLHPMLYRGFVALLSLRMRAAYDWLEEAAVAPFSVRLARRLLSLAQQAGDARAPRREVVLTHEELGQLLGRTRQSVAKQLTEWQSEGILGLSYGRITIEDPQRLAALTKMRD